MQSKLKNCGSPEHSLHRRMFLQGTAAASATTMFSFHSLFTAPAFAEEFKRQQKHCILLWLCGAPSQFETWDPKPGRISSGPWGAIPTNVTGTHVGEMMSQSSKIMDKISLVRSMKTSESEHFQGISLLNRGEKPRPPFVRPTLGSVLGQQLSQLDSPIPDFILLDPCPEGNEFKAFKKGNWAGWLGAEYSPVRVGGKYQIPNIAKLAEVTGADHSDREALRMFLSRKYENDHKSASAKSMNAAFERVKGLMSCADLFDMEKLAEKDRERYGPGAFGLHCLQARHLVENGAPFVMVANGMPWDCHVMNHEIYQMLVPELDNVIFHLISDLEERGMLDQTLVIMMGEFGRTPWLNAARGRDHYPNAWSLALAGCGIKPGVVFGGTDPDGVDVAENAVDQRRLFATLFTALGIDPHEEYDLPGFPSFHRVEKEAQPIKEILR